MVNRPVIIYFSLKAVCIVPALTIAHNGGGMKSLGIAGYIPVQLH
jgi:hypothetical protein